MNSVRANVVVRFADEFCFGRRGFSLVEIPRWFERYQAGMPVVGSEPAHQTKGQLFAECVSRLSPQNQRLALYDLCDVPPSATNPMPDAPTRLDLLKLLMQADGRSTLGLDLSRLSLDGVRQQWEQAADRVGDSPSGAVTAARTLVESACRTILTELGQAPDSSGDLLRLYGQTRQALGINPGQGTGQAAHRMMKGLLQAVEGLAALSNVAGDRHGLAGGVRLADEDLAGLAVHAAGTVSLALGRIYKTKVRGVGSAGAAVPSGV